MWWECIPATALIFVGLSLPAWGLYQMHYLVLGNHFRRTLIERWQRREYQRDWRLTGNPYNVKTLNDMFSGEE